jgi:acyl carrier protein
MIPDNFVQLSFLPITANGKLDLESLPEPEFSPADNYKLPEKNTEKYLCQIWAEVLGIDEEKIGIYDDFFKLGGNSLLSIKLANKINKLLGVTITTSSIYKNNTVDKLVFFIESNIAENQNRTEYEV